MREIDPNIIISAALTLAGVLVGTLKSSADIKELKEENKKLKNKNLELEKKLQNFTDFSLKPDGIYYDKNGIPFCPACFANAKFVPLSQRHGTSYYSHVCPACSGCYRSPYLSFSQN